MTITKKDLSDALDEVLNKKRVIDDDTHKLHHQFIAMQIEKQERRDELFRKFQASFVGGVALGLLGFLGWIGKYVLDLFQTGQHP